MSDKLNAADHMKRLHEALAGLTSGDEYLRWLRFYNSFHQYSFGNTLLIQFQRPSATMVKGFQQWAKEHNRHVKKGERGIAILAPMQLKRDKDAEPDEAEYFLRFKVVYVFDVEQTEGDELPTAPTVNKLEDGEVPAGAQERLMQLIEAQGFSALVEINRDGLGSANGKTDYAHSIVSIAPDLTNMQKLKTTAHELAHVLMHGPKERAAIPQEQVEVEAESVAAIVCSALGIDSHEYSLGYIAQWAAKDPRAVLRSAERCAKTAQQIIDEMENQLEQAA